MVGIPYCCYHGLPRIIPAFIAGFIQHGRGLWHSKGCKTLAWNQLYVVAVNIMGNAVWPAGTGYINMNALAVGMDARHTGRHANHTRGRHNLGPAMFYRLLQGPTGHRFILSRITQMIFPDMGLKRAAVKHLHF
ncbi:hypothetical protein TH9_15385 [Thalassospira xiamenensis]|nr:hypothetical protein TH9_15385 [Thalassospira xiamenensis]